METSGQWSISQGRDEEHLRLLAIFHYVVAALGALFACFPLIHVAIGVMMVTSPEFMTSGQQGGPPPAAFGTIFIVVGGMFVLLGWAAAVCIFISGRLLARRRARMFSLVTAAFLCVVFPVGTALGVFTIIVLTRESVQHLYARS